MGLDVCLYKFKNFKKTMALEKRYNKKTDAIWKEIQNGRPYTVLTEDEKRLADEKIKNLYDSIYLNEPDDTKICIDTDSSLYPEHLFKIGYFRSSYNGGGLNSVLRRTIGKDLYNIFDPPDDGYYFKPDWEQSLFIAREIKEEFEKHIDECPFDVLCESSRYSAPNIKSEKEALDEFMKQKKECSRDFSEHTGRAFCEFTDKNGTFFLGEDPLKLRAIINGENQWGNCCYIIYEKIEGYKWLLEALEIVIETIIYVLSQPDKEKYILGWSS